MRYVETGDPEPAESPKPYVHPLRTLAGDVVTVYRPHDHRWHKGLQLTASHVSGQNFWGGGTYVHGQGYVQLDNNGTMRHDTLDVTADGLRGTLTWRTSYGEPWVAEERALTIAAVDPGNGSWELHWRSTLTGLREDPLAFGSPTTHGRPMAGYSGLFWRGPRDFTGGELIGPDDRGGEELMGQRADWVAFHGRHDEVDRESTLVFVPEQDCDWFVRTEWFAAVNPSWAFHREFPLARGESVSVGYRIVIATGAWDRERIGKYLRS
ncbi:MAG: PmoA family protein [Nonomuraea sp.]|nr:PmoA family protein [Nonomuraea sp.]